MKNKTLFGREYGAMSFFSLIDESSFDIKLQLVSYIMFEKIIGREERSG